MKTINYIQAVGARKALDQSQAKVAMAIGINRAYLSQFESGRRILEDAHLIKLREFFETEGYDFSASEHKSETPIKTIYRKIDGVDVGDYLSQSELEAISEEFYQNAAAIETAVSKPMKRRMFGRVSETDAMEKAFPVLALMARQHVLREALQGRAYFIEYADKHADLSSVKTVGDVVTCVLQGLIDDASGADTVTRRVPVSLIPEQSHLAKIESEDTLL